MSFKTDVQGITSLTVGVKPTDAELSSFLADGVRDVVNRMISSRPEELSKFTATTHDAADSGITHTGQILSVVREHDSTSILRPCEIINPNDRYEASDSSSLKYRSKYNPAFYFLNGKIFTIPASAGGNNDSVVTQVHYDTGVDSTIDNFPTEYQHLVVLYASMRTIFAVMASKTAPTSIDTFSMTAVPPDAVVFEQFEISPTKSVPTFTQPSAYVPPTVSGISSDLTESMSSSDSQTDFGDWWEKWGDMIEDTDDPEIAGAHGAKVSAFVGAYQAASANKLNIFNTALQSNVNKFNSDLQAYTQEINTLIAEKGFEIQAEHAAKLQQFQADLSAYQADVNMEVSEYGQKLARFQAEMSKVAQEYQWLQDQYMKIKVEYDAGFGAQRRPQAAPQEEGERG
jgi:hypothetical protein